ncbi:DUF2182 domain-containing protein [Mycobacterium aquaticum]|uniref:copper chaperone n=1 Tax=Mycobacterium aquaticum TaxID=1927124 RepID=UPI001301FEF7|nr:DUF2182 domain-containing protein [Mycobacterium aquaticum]
MAPRPSAWRRTQWMHPELSLLAVAAVAWLAVIAGHTVLARFHVAAQHCSAPLPGGVTVGHHHAAVGPALAMHQCAGPHPVSAWAFLTSVVLWSIMATAMMLPTAVPAARSIALNGKWKRRQRGQMLFAAGYLAVWSVAGLVVLTIGWLVVPVTTASQAVAGVLAVAAWWEVTRWKRRCLLACHRMRSIPPDGRAADTACIREGLRNGVWCAGACGPMMTAMALAPHAWWLMLTLSPVVAAEKLVTKAVDHLRVFAAVLVVVAAVAAAGAPLT